MAAPQESREHLTAYERAVCYYTIPRVTSPLTGGLIIAYTLVLLEALGLLAYGVLNESENLTWWGAAFSIGAIVFGMIAFFVRGFQNQFLERRALAQAARVPDTQHAITGLPDPFAGHVLLRYRRRSGEREFCIEDNDGVVRYRVRSVRHDRHFEIFDAEGQPVAEVEAFSARRSFLFEFSRIPGRVLVHRGDTEIAKCRRRYTFMDPSCDIYISNPAELHIVTRRGAFYRGERLVGRMYIIRQTTYLDIESKSLSGGILGYYVAMA